MENIELTKEAADQLDEIIEAIGGFILAGAPAYTFWTRPILEGVKESLAECNCFIESYILVDSWTFIGYQF